jgi:hypothetical protein
VGHSLLLDRAEVSHPESSVLYTAPSGALMFAAGAIAWGEALASANRWDARAQAVTANVVSRLAARWTSTVPASWRGWRRRGRSRSRRTAASGSAMSSVTLCAA